MIETGDWITVRQQGQIFPERPPMSVWGIAVAGLVRGEVDTMAVRLPSVLAIVLTCLLVYGYARGFISQLGAFAAALVFATMGQVLQIGRMGESESLFTLLFASSLLLWHLAYERGWNATVTWSLGFGFAALAALVKGPQAPVYFVAITAVYLSLRKDWRQLFTRSSLVGAGIFTAIVAAWQIPYYLKTDTASVMATWTGLASDRFGFGGLLEHMTMFPTGNSYLLATLVTTAGCTTEPQDPRVIAGSVRDVYVPGDLTLRDISVGLVCCRCSWPVLHAALSAGGRFDWFGYRTVLYGAHGNLSPPSMAPVPGGDDGCECVCCLGCPRDRLLCK